MPFNFEPNDYRIERLELLAIKMEATALGLRTMLSPAQPQLCPYEESEKSHYWWMGFLDGQALGQAELKYRSFVARETGRVR